MFECPMFGFREDNDGSQGEGTKEPQDYKIRGVEELRLKGWIFAF